MEYITRKIIEEQAKKLDISLDFIKYGDKQRLYANCQFAIRDDIASNYEKYKKEYFACKDILALSTDILPRKIIEDIEKCLKTYEKAYKISSAIIRRDWEEVGICGKCHGCGLIPSRDAMASRGDMDSCDCSYGLIEGWVLINEYPNYKNKTINMGQFEDDE